MKTAMTRKEFPKYLRETRARLGLTVAAAGKILGFKIHGPRCQTLERWEAGQAPPLAVTWEGVMARYSQTATLDPVAIKVRNLAAMPVSAKVETIKGRPGKGVQVGKGKPAAMPAKAVEAVRHLAKAVRKIAPEQPHAALPSSGTYKPLPKRGLGSPGFRVRKGRTEAQKAADAAGAKARREAKRKAKDAAFGGVAK